uniref:ATP synthase complex subunit 8 n=1 Tax=Neotermes nr. kartaboensis TaxID=2942760 RepID=A0A8X8M1X4_9NEOP|nr:ATP synthase F0 subunit 8 [Neotermes nr. kartaboensis]
MPQMMPMSWLTLFMMFSTTLILFASMNFYTMTPKISTTLKKMMTTKKMNWKW